MIGMVPGMIVAPLLANKIGKKKVFTAGIFICAIGPALRLFAPTSLTMAYVGTLVASLGAGFIMPLELWRAGGQYIVCAVHYRKAC